MVRITHPYDNCKALVRTWAESCERMIVYEHVGSVTEKVHIHIVIEGSEYHKKWLRELGSRQGVILKTNKYCSFKEFDGDKRAIVYMTKGINDPKYNKGYSEEDIALWKSQWVDHPKSKDAMLYDSVFGDDEYMDGVYKDWYERNQEQLDKELNPRFKWVKSIAYSRALLHNGYIVNIKTINDYKMLVYTYCAQHDLFIPDDPVFKHYG